MPFFPSIREGANDAACTRFDGNAFDSCFYATDGQTNIDSIENKKSGMDQTTYSPIASFLTDA